MAKTAALSFRIEPELKEALQQLATADDRTLANYIERVLKEHVEAVSKRKR